MTTEKKQAGAVVPAQSTIPISQVAAAYKHRAETADALTISLAHQLDQAFAQIAALRAEIERLKAPAKTDDKKD